MAKMKKYAEGGELPQAMVDRMAREENKADRELVTKPARAIAEGAKKMYNAATGKGAKDFTPRTSLHNLGDDLGIGESQDTTAVKSPVGDAPNLPGFGTAVRPLNMGKKSKAPKAADYAAKDKKEGVLRGSEYKAGGSVKTSSASKRADGCAVRGKTRA